jgi:hypothetical protein
VEHPQEAQPVWVELVPNLLEHLLQKRATPHMGVPHCVLPLSDRLSGVYAKS